MDRHRQRLAPLHRQRVITLPVGPMAGDCGPHAIQHALRLLLGVQTTIRMVREYLVRDVLQSSSSQSTSAEIPLWMQAVLLKLLLPGEQHVEEALANDVLENHSTCSREH